jgi:nucleoside-diphosphate-sugar epimerase
MRIFLAGASGAIGRRLVRLLCADRHDVVGTTRSQAKAGALRLLGVTPAVVNVFVADVLMQAVQEAMPDVVIHQLTDLPQVADPVIMPAALEANARLRIDGTRNLMAAAKAAGVKRVIAQSIAFVYAPGEGARVETDPLATETDGSTSTSIQGVIALEEQVLGTPGIDGIVLRYGRLYGPGTWSEAGPPGPGSLHVDAAAQAAHLALTRGAPGIYNIAEEDGAYAIAKARRELGFDPEFRMDTR